MKWYWFSQRGLEESGFVRLPWYKRLWYKLTGKHLPVLWVGNLVVSRTKPMTVKWSKPQDPDSWTAPPQGKPPKPPYNKEVI